MFFVAGRLFTFGKSFSDSLCRSIQHRHCTIDALEQFNLGTTTTNGSGQKIKATHQKQKVNFYLNFVVARLMASTILRSYECASSKSKMKIKLSRMIFRPLLSQSPRLGKRVNTTFIHLHVFGEHPKNQKVLFVRLFIRVFLLHPPHRNAKTYLMMMMTNQSLTLNVLSHTSDVDDSQI